MNKLCSRCGVEKTLEDFVRSSRNTTGFTNKCKSCHRLISKKSVAANPDKRRQTCSKYYLLHKTQHFARVASWAASNPEKIRQIAAKCRVTNAEKIKAYRKRFGAACQRKMRALWPEKFKARCVVNNAVARGKLPRVKSLMCSRCGSPAKEYHHHKGYSPEFYMDVVPLCKPCHNLLK